MIWRNKHVGTHHKWRDTFFIHLFKNNTCKITFSIWEIVNIWRYSVHYCILKHTFRCKRKNNIFYNYLGAVGVDMQDFFVKKNAYIHVLETIVKKNVYAPLGFAIIKLDVHRVSYSFSILNVDQHKSNLFEMSRQINR